MPEDKQITTHTKWRPRTLRDAIPERAARAEVRDALRGARADVDNPTVTCACGRRTSADMCLDLRAVPAAVRQAFRHDDPFPCDGCVRRAIATGGLTEQALAIAVGAPADQVAHARRHDLARVHEEALFEEVRRSLGTSNASVERSA